MLLRTGFNGKNAVGLARPLSGQDWSAVGCSVVRRQLFPLKSQRSRKYFSVVRGEEKFPSYPFNNLLILKTVGMGELAFNAYGVSVWEDGKLWRW